MDSYETYPEGTDVTYVGDVHHAAPPILVGKDGQVHGKIKGRAGLGLYKVDIEMNETVVAVQLHEAQIRHRETGV